MKKTYTPAAQRIALGPRAVLHYDAILIMTAVQ